MNHGGLEVLNLRAQNEAPLLFLHKYLNREGLLRVNRIWGKYYQNGRLPPTANKGSFW
jgi:hypothetical protein